MSVWCMYGRPFKIDVKNYLVRCNAPFGLNPDFSDLPIHGVVCNYNDNCPALLESLESLESLEEQYDTESSCKKYEHLIPGMERILDLTRLVCIDCVSNKPSGTSRSSKSSRTSKGVE